MFATATSFRAVLFLFFVSFTGSAPIHSQSSSILNSSDLADVRSSPRSPLENCAALTVGRPASGRSMEFREWSAVARHATQDEFSTAGVPEAFCVESASREQPHALADNPCPVSAVGARPGPGLPHNPVCNYEEDAVPAELSALGKAGVKIARAREEVLAILRSDNACTEWFASKDATPAPTFQSLSFILDKHGPQDIFESALADSILLWRQPYVASATQDGGAHTAITINAHGAFYRPQGTVLKVSQEGGPVHSDGARLLTVGSYRGDTIQAQMVTLLHELGHIIDLLPEDADNLDGKSVKNTDAVLRHCRTEIEERAKQARDATGQ
jgi:hypothetical protein